MWNVDRDAMHVETRPWKGSVQLPQLKRSKVEDKREILVEGTRRSFRFQRSNELSRSNGHQVLHPFSIFLFDARRLVTRLYEGYNLSPLLTMFCSLRMLINLHLVVFLLQPPPPLGRMLVHRRISPNPPPRMFFRLPKQPDKTKLNQTK